VLSIPRSVRIYIASAPTDMRRSIDGLMALVTDELKEDAYSGHLFVFLSRRADRVKILTWDNGGFVLYYKRLEQGRFRPLQVDASATAVEIGATQLLMLLDGIDLSRVRNPKHWKRPEACPMDNRSPT
jgi:transposase